MTDDELFRVEVSGDTISLIGDLDAHTATLLDEAVGALVESGGDRIVLRIRDVGFVDSSGLRSMIRARNGGGDARTVVIEEPTPATLRLLEITGMTEQFVIDPAS